MGILSGLKKLAGRLVDVRVDRWVSWRYMKDSTANLTRTFKYLFVPATPQYSETFEEAMERLKLSETDITHRKKEFLRLVCFFSVTALLLLGYSFYWLRQMAISATLISFCLAGFCLAQAFRFHFWYFQMSQRKLGCTLQEWWDSQLLSHLRSDRKRDD